jgi:hypothetical protein
MEEERRRLFPSFSIPSRWRSRRRSEETRGDEYRMLREKVFRRDKSRCTYCGFVSRKGLHLHHRDRDPTNDRLGNLETVCMMCHLVLHAGFASQVIGVLDFYAESDFSQNEIVRITRRLRASGVADLEIRRILGLRDQREFVADTGYLTQLKAFLTNRVPTDSGVQLALEEIYVEERNNQARDRLATLPSLPRASRMN